MEVGKRALALLLEGSMGSFLQCSDECGSDVECSFGRFLSVRPRRVNGAAQLVMTTAIDKTV